MLEPELKHEINRILHNWSIWCRGGWPRLTYSQLPTSRDYLPQNPFDKPLPMRPVNVTTAEAANHAVFNLALAGDARSYQIIVDWWVYHQPARLMAKTLHCSIRSVYNYREYAMYQFWPEYVREIEGNRRRKRSVVHEIRFA